MLSENEVIENILYKFVGIINTNDISRINFSNNDTFIIKVPKEKKNIDGNDVEVDGEFKLSNGLIVHDNDMLTFVDGSFILVKNITNNNNDLTIHTYEWNDALINDEKVVKISDVQKLICNIQTKFNITIPLNIINY